MIEYLEQTSVEFQAILFMLYNIFLAILLWRSHSYWLLFYVNLGVVVVLAGLFLSDYLLYVFCALIAPLGIPALVLSTKFEARRVEKYLKGFPQNVPEEVAVVCEHRPSRRFRGAVDYCHEINVFQAENHPR